jgi:putative Ca2+/H+ antiporter (TMEM165/GDT1 family)
MAHVIDATHRWARPGNADAARPGALAFPCVHPCPGPENTLNAFLVSLVAVAIAEIGDKTQLLSLTLAAKYRRPWPICIGIFIATLVNHAMAGGVGALLAHWISPRALQWCVVVSFIVMAAWALIPDKPDDEAAKKHTGHALVIATIITFFIAEMGDKTQIATAVLAAQFGNVVAVVAGTTLGMLIADVPVVLLGNAGARRIPFKLVRMIAAALFALMGVVALVAPLPT